MDGQEISGYEIHAGRSEGATPWLEINQRSGEPVQVLDGAMRPDGRVWGCYLHGIFGNLSLRRAWLTSLGWRASPQTPDPFTESLARLADAVEASFDMNLLEKIVWDSSL